MIATTAKFVPLASDAATWFLASLLVGYAVRLRRRPTARRAWITVFEGAPAFCSAVVLAAMCLVALVDSIHFRVVLPTARGEGVVYEPQTESLLDLALRRLRAGREVSYSEPLAMHALDRTAVEVDGRLQQVHPRLVHGGADLAGDTDRLGDLALRASLGLVAGVLAAATVAIGMAAALARASRCGLRCAALRLLRDRTRLPWRAAIITMATLTVLAGMAVALGARYHLFGTDRTGNDVLFQALKSLRTAFVIGGVSTAATLPLAAVFGIAAGYFRGWVDATVTYVYTLLSSTPNVLLIAACMLLLQTTLDAHPGWFETSVERADVRLLLLCLVLGFTTWATLCRLLRAETIRLCSLDIVQAARASGLTPLRIMWRHLLPNVAHLILITTVLDFSSLVLYEAVLSFIGIGVDPSMNSFGNMIDLARTELAGDPLVWWSFAAAFVFMVALVLAANVLADGVRDAFDPRGRIRRIRRLAPTEQTV